MFMCGIRIMDYQLERNLVFLRAKDYGLPPGSASLASNCVHHPCFSTLIAGRSVNGLGISVSLNTTTICK